MSSGFFLLKGQCHENFDPFLVWSENLGPLYESKQKLYREILRLGEDIP